MDDKKQISIRDDASKFRRAIEQCKQKLGVSFEQFPLGSCGDVADLLGQFLQDQGYGEFRYVCGWRALSSEHQRQSHAWVQQDDLIVDITADQFEEIEDAVIVTTSSSWHRTFDIESEHAGGISVYDARTTASLRSMYGKIITQIEASPDQHEKA